MNGIENSLYCCRKRDGRLKNRAIAVERIQMRYLTLSVPAEFHEIYLDFFILRHLLRHFFTVWFLRTSYTKNIACV
jgi:hypothetical protein